jgi:hypothetical protein
MASPPPPCAPPPAEHTTAAERAAGVLGPAKLHRLADEFAARGFVTLGGVVGDACLDKLGAGLDLAAAAVLLKAGPGGDAGNGGGTASWWKTRTLGPVLPRGAPWVDSEVVANPIIEQVVLHLLGGAAFIRWYGSNTVLPMPPATAAPPPRLREGWEGAPGLQHVHMDGFGWSMQSAEEAAGFGLPWPHDTFKIFVNVGVHGGMGPHNGSTQVWPASHRVEASATAMACDVTKVEAETMGPLIRARAAAPATAPVQVQVPRGATLFRDLRLWHRGMPNLSPFPRHMLSIAFAAERDPGAETSFLGRGKHFHVFSASCKAAFEAGRLGTEALVHRNARFVDGSVDGGGRVAGDANFALALDDDTSDGSLSMLSRPVAVLAPLVNGADIENMPHWLRELVRGRVLNRNCAAAAL